MAFRLPEMIEFKAERGYPVDPASALMEVLRWSRQLIQSLGVQLATLEFRINNLAAVTGLDFSPGPPVSMVAEAYGGMRFQTTTPVTRQIGTTPVKLTDFNEEVPENGNVKYITFDPATDEVVVENGQGGIFLFSLYLGFFGEQGEIYTVQAYVDSGSGPQPAGNPAQIRVSQADPEGTYSISVLVRANGGWRVSLWINADKANTDFAPQLMRVDLTRVSQRLPDNHGSEAFFGVF